MKGQHRELKIIQQLSFLLLWFGTRAFEMDVLQNRPAMTPKTALVLLALALCIVRDVGRNASIRSSSLPYTSEERTYFPGMSCAEVEG